MIGAVESWVASKEAAEPESAPVETSEVAGSVGYAAGALYPVAEASAEAATAAASEPEAVG